MNNSISIFILAILIIIVIIIINIVNEPFSSVVENNCPDKVVTQDGRNFYLSYNNNVDKTKVFINPGEVILYLKRKYPHCNYNLPIESKTLDKPVVKSMNDPTVGYLRQCNKEVSLGGYKNKVCMIDKLANDVNMPYDTMYNSIFQDGRGIIFPILDVYTNKESITDLMTDKVFSI